MTDLLNYLQPDTLGGRIAAVALVAGILIGVLVVVWRFFSSSFFRGFVVSTGVFLSFDIVLVHWVMGLHRITEGSEANFIEPLFVAIGIGFTVYGLRNEPRKPRTAPSN